MWPSDQNALTITTGEELERFDLGDIVIGPVRYTVLTGYEKNERRCWWCNAELRRKAKHYCYGHMTAYYDHFRWGYASYEARKRAGYRCENCGMTSKIAVHHIVPLKGAPRFFSAYNLPWNLVVLCKTCHLEIHAAMRPAKKEAVPAPPARLPMFPEL
jgi:5-methylcytosine-specific restriction endonuclease McrA